MTSAGARDALVRRSIAVAAWCNRHRKGLAVTVGVGGLALYGFAEVADAVSEEETAALDRGLLLALRTPGDPTDPLGPAWFEEVGRDLTALGGVAVLTLLTLATVAYALMRREKVTATVLALAVGGGMALSLLAKRLFDRPRPDLVPHGSLVYTQSFPSGHSMMSAVTYLTLAVLLMRIQEKWILKAYVLALGVLLTFLVGVSRVYLGVHWPTDVLAGWAAGAAWATLSWFVCVYLQERRGIHPERDGVPEQPPLEP